MKLDKLWIDEFKNLRDVYIDFDETSLSTVLIGQNGSGKSNLLEAIASIFCNLDFLDEPPFNYILEYEIWGKHIRIDADLKRERDKTIVKVTEQKVLDNKIVKIEEKRPFRSLVENNRQYLPNNIFGYYSGVNHRFAEIFEKHLDKYSQELKKEYSEQPLRSLFLADPSYGQFVLITLFASGDEDSLGFLKNNFHITDVDSIIFKMKEPYWHIGKGTAPTDGLFWGAKGVVGDFLTKLSAISTHTDKELISINLSNKKPWKEEQFKLKIKDVTSLQNLLTKEYVTPVKFFKMLESTYISDIIDKVEILVKKEGINDRIEFEELSEGEQQVLLIIGLLRFMNEKESLFLLDEPETHLNPAWRYNFLRMLEKEVRRTEKSHIIIATHDPLLIGSLTKEQVQVFSVQNDDKSVSIEPPDIDPRGMGIDGILTSEIFGLYTALDFKTQESLDRRHKLFVKKKLSAKEKADLEQLDNDLSKLGFVGTVRDPLYSKFLIALREHRIANKADFQKLDRDKQAALVKKAIDEIEASKE